LYGWLPTLLQGLTGVVVIVTVGSGEQLQLLCRLLCQRRIQFSPQEAPRFLGPFDRVRKPGYNSPSLRKGERTHDHRNHAMETTAAEA
jgi:hypothetical protein